jgi:hypothetical protein
VPLLNRTDRSDPNDALLFLGWRAVRPGGQSGDRSGPNDPVLVSYAYPAGASISPINDVVTP